MSGVPEKLSPGQPKRKVLLLAYAFPPENLPGAARPWRFYRYLPEFGYEPFVITGSPQDPERPNANVTCVPDLTEASPPRSPRRLIQAAIRKTIRPGDVGSLWTPDAFGAAKQLLRKGPISAVYSTFPSLNVHLVALALKKRHGLPWIADFRDALSDNIFGLRTKVSRLFEDSIEKWIVSEADALTIVSDAIADQWRKRYPRHAHKIHLLWNGFDPDQPVRPAPLPVRPYRVLAHIGTFYGGRTPAPVLGSVARLIERGQLDPARFRLRFVGDFTPENQTLFDMAARTGCLEYENRHAPRPEALRVMAESDYLLMADNNSLLAGLTFTVPAKLFEYIQVGRPILALTEPDSPVDRILKGSGIPIVTIQAGLPEPEVDRRLLNFLQLPSDPPIEPSAWFQETFDGRRQTGTLAALLNSIVLNSISKAHA